MPLRYIIIRCCYCWYLLLLLLLWCGEPVYWPVIVGILVVHLKVLTHWYDYIGVWWRLTRYCYDLLVGVVIVGIDDCYWWWPSVAVIVVIYCCCYSVLLMIPVMTMLLMWVLQVLSYCWPLIWWLRPLLWGNAYCWCSFLVLIHCIVVEFVIIVIELDLGRYGVVLLKYLKSDVWYCWCWRAEYIVDCWRWVLLWWQYCWRHYGNSVLLVVMPLEGRL